VVAPYAGYGRGPDEPRLDPPGSAALSRAAMAATL